jgi:hypothetical protein
MVSVSFLSRGDYLEGRVQEVSSIYLFFIVKSGETFANVPGVEFQGCWVH